MLLAEREGFEPSVPLPVRQISNLVPSTTRPPLRSLESLHYFAGQSEYGAGVFAAGNEPQGARFSVLRQSASFNGGHDFRRRPGALAPASPGEFRSLPYCARTIGLVRHLKRHEKRGTETEALNQCTFALGRRALVNGSNSSIFARARKHQL